MQANLLFSLLFFATFTAYLFFGIYVIHSNPKNKHNILFVAMCISLCFWSLGFSIANFAPNVETCLFWRRISAIGWSSIYSILLHYIVFLVKGKCPRKTQRLCMLFYIPAVISLYAFAFSNKITSTQFNFIRTEYGWVNVAVNNAWTVFFNIYYISYVFVSLILLGISSYKNKNKDLRKLSSLVGAALAVSLILGTLTDVILSSQLATPLPQMAPVFTLLPIAAIYYGMKRFHLMRETPDVKETLILTSKTRTRLNFYLIIAYLFGGILSVLSHFLKHLMSGDHSLEANLYSALVLFAFGLIMIFVQFMKNEKIKTSLMLLTMVLSIPVISFRYIWSAGITIWVIPIVLMIASLTFNSRGPLGALTVISIITQLFMWRYKPAGNIYFEEFDYIVRIGLFLIAFWLGSFVNKTYTQRLKENIYQIEFQKLISDVSTSFISANQLNLDAKINTMLESAGSFFGVDRCYIFLYDFDNDTMTNTYEWCDEGIEASADIIQAEPLDSFSWWVSELSNKNLVYAEDINELPPEAQAEKDTLLVQEVKSVIAIPIFQDNMQVGFMGFDHVLAKKKWTEHHIKMLELLGNLLADALIKVKAEKEIEYMAYYDHLTGLPNRLLFSDRLTQAIHLAKRNDKFIGVIFIDLDSFKMVNDTMGHSAGDILLKKIAQSLQQRLRKTDTVARFGGDEFLLFVNDIGKAEHITKVVDHFMKLFENPFIINDQDFYVTSSAGVAVFPQDGEDAETLIKNADIAMYSAKAKGKNQYALCTSEMKEEIRTNIRLSNSLYRVQERKELMVYYQPQIKLQTGKFVGLEALLRWKHPELGMIPPNVFIPLSEMNGTINKIGDWVLTKSIEQNKIWQEKGFPHLRMAVNLSIIQFSNPNFADRLDQILKEHDLDPKYLELEITESIATREAEHIANTLTKLKSMGVSISIDDFGTEYSSLNRLKILPIDRIKIDMQFIQGIENSEKDRAITKVVINLAKSLGIEVLAEGVETKIQRDFLNQRMCDEVQGYYYFKPMPAEKVEELLLLQENNGSSL